MPIFSNKHSIKDQNGSTTKNFQIGSPEAEAESTHRAKVKLYEVFEDFLNIIPELEYEKFIITGRKGSGKSAIGEYLCYQATQKPNLFVNFIKKEDIDIESIVQIVKEKGQEIQEELLFKWVILIKIIKLLTENESISSRPGMKDLRHFISRNSGYVNIKTFEITEILKSEGGEIKIDNLKSFMAKYGKNIQIKSERAHFYKLIPHLEEVIKALIQNDPNENKYLILFDDLDIGIKLANASNKQTLINLLRITKDINNNFFGKNKIDAKVILLLRNDIARHLKKADADTAKIISSYEIPISWFENELLKKDENSLKIKKFIDKRIRVNFEKCQIKMSNELNPWSSLIEENNQGYVNTSFRYVIDHTFCKPRDLILFFKPLSEFEFKIPLLITDINKLIGRYANEAIDEISNELLIHITQEEWNSITRACKYFEKDQIITYDALSSRLSLYSFTKEIDEIIELLFNYSIIGNKNNGIPYFKHKEPRDQTFEFDKNTDVIFHYIFKVYLHNAVSSTSFAPSTSS